MDGWMEGQTIGWMDGWTDGRMDGWTDGQMDGWMDEWTEGQNNGDPEKIAMCGIIGHRLLRGHCPKKERERKIKPVIQGYDAV